MRKIVLTMGLLVTATSSVAAQKIIQDQGFFRNLLKDSSLVLDILSGGFGQSGNVSIPDLPYPVTTEPLVKFVRNKHGVFMSLDASGRIYQIKDNAPDLDLIRRDSTIFFGYNFGSYFFTHNDTLFSYGGYGYWNINGHLRYFKYDQAEWELVPLSKEIKVRKGDADFSYNSWFDQSKGSLYVLKSMSHPDSVYALDMKKKEWLTLGKRIHDQTLSYFISTPWGLMCSNSDTESSPQYLLLDFYNNSISTLNSTKTAELTASIYPDFKAFIRDSSLCIQKRFDENGLNELRLSKADFEPTDDKIYDPLPEPSITNSLMKFAIFNWHIIVALGAVFMVGLLLGNRNQKRTIQNSKHVNNTAGNQDVFDLKEIDLVKLILNKSHLNQTTSIEEINRVLGVSGKSPDMQKKHRSDVINSINNKYRLVSGRSENLLSSKRSDFDKRSFEYLITSDEIAEIGKFFENIF